MNNTNFKISSPFLSCFNNLSGLYFEVWSADFGEVQWGVNFNCSMGAKRNLSILNSRLKTIVEELRSDARKTDGNPVIDME